MVYTHALKCGKRESIVLRIDFEGAVPCGPRTPTILQGGNAAMRQDAQMRGGQTKTTYPAAAAQTERARNGRFRSNARIVE